MHEMLFQGLTLEKWSPNLERMAMNYGNKAKRTQSIQQEKVQPCKYDEDAYLGGGESDGGEILPVDGAEVEEGQQKLSTPVN